LLTLSAQTGNGLDQATLALREFLDRSESVNLGDVAHTLQRGRSAFAHRRILVCSGREDALSALTGKESNRIFSSRLDDARRPAIFMLPGIGDQYVGMAHDLYSSWEVFRQEVDRCAQILEPHLGIDIRTVLYPANQAWKKVAQSKGIDLKRMLGRNTDEPPDPDTALLNTTRLAQPALFTVEYAMARLWLSLGITPDAMVGHSMGEYVAACLAGVLSLEDALRLIAVRARLINELPQAIMLAVMHPEEELRTMLPPDVYISLINGPSHCVIAGPPEAVSAVEQVLATQEIIARRVQNGHAFHTPMMEPVLAPFAAEIAKVQLHEPRIRYLSNVTGDWITAAQATDPTYWIRHLSHTARFSDGLRRLWQIGSPLLIECGPGRTLSVLAAQHPDRKATLQSGIWSLRQRYENDLDERVLLAAIGKVWLAGGAISWDRMAAPPGVRRRIPLPAYPHAKEHYWSSSAPTAQPSTAIDPAPSTTDAASAAEDDSPANPRERELLRIWQNALGRPNMGVNDSFGALGGDSLSSIGVLMEMKRVGVPDEVARGIYRGLTIRDMVREETEVESGTVAVSGVGKIPLASVETPIFIRAFGIYLVVASHFGLTALVGNPVLMMVSGLSFAKFQLQAVAREGSIKPVFRFMLRLAIPTFLDTLARQLAHASFHPRSFLLMDNLMEPWPFGPYESPYFLDLLLQNMLIAALPLSIAAIRAFAVRKTFAYGMIFFTTSWIASMVVPFFWDRNNAWIFVPHVYMWLLAFGWCAAQSATYKQKLLLSVLFLCMNEISHLFGHGLRSYVVAAALLLAWFDELPLQIPSVLVRIMSAAAAASLFIYLTHYSFSYLIRALWTGLSGRPWADFPTLLTIALSMLGGYFVWRAWERISRKVQTAFGWLKPTPAPAGSW
jgi:malonyl CoA-acyl carrier protein transacylase